MVQGCTDIPGGECHRHENGFGNETTAFRTFGLNGQLAWMETDVQTNHGGSFAHVQWFSCQNDRADYHDVMW